MAKGKSKPKILSFNKNDTNDIFKTAEAFNRIGVEIAFRWAELKKDDRQDSIDSMDLAVSATNILFSLELYLKGINLALNGSFSEKHSLLFHYEQLSAQYKKTIKEEFQKRGRESEKGFPIIRRLSFIARKIPSYDPFKPEITIEEFLLAHNEGFVEWRYQFDQRTGEDLYADFAMMLCMTEALKWFINGQVLPRLDQKS